MMIRTAPFFCKARSLHRGLGGLKASSVSSQRWYASFVEILKDLRKVDTSCECDADKAVLAGSGGINHEGLQLMKGWTFQMIFWL